MSQDIREEETRICGRAKASGVHCSIQREVYNVLKAGGEAMMKWLQETCNLVWRHCTGSVQ